MQRHEIVAFFRLDLCCQGYYIPLTNDHSHRYRLQQTPCCRR
jgi:hypothetical protein